MSAHLTSLWMLASSALLADEPDAPPSVRAQTAVVRTLADTLGHLSPSSEAAASICEQLVDELARLGTLIASVPPGPLPPAQDASNETSSSAA
jgi:hypothetical protein